MRIKIQHIRVSCIWLITTVTNQYDLPHSNVSDHWRYSYFWTVSQRNRNPAQTQLQKMTDSADHWPASHSSTSSSAARSQSSCSSSTTFVVVTAAVFPASFFFFLRPRNTHTHTHTHTVLWPFSTRPRVSQLPVTHATFCVVMLVTGRDVKPGISPDLAVAGSSLIHWMTSHCLRLRTCTSDRHSTSGDMTRHLFTVKKIWST